MANTFGSTTRTAVLSIASSGNNEVIAAPTDGYIAIDHINLLTASAVDLQFKSGSTAKSGVYPLDTKQAIVLENVTQFEGGVITCARNEAFNINLGAGVQVSGFVRYRIVGGTN